MGQYFETYRATVKPEQCDHLGHMNVQYYIAALNDGTIELVRRLGLPLAEIARRRIALAVVRMETDFLRELKEGDEILVESAVEQVGNKSLTLLHRIRHAASGSDAMRSVCRSAMMDLTSRKSTVLPEDVRAAALALANDDGGR
ncbi:MAG TPA: thioesterase family protein [bacterium]|nr:thioesterase family protein [bacterium]